MGQYDKFSFDTSGKMYGEKNITDPVTGQTVTEQTPICQMALSSFANASSLQRSGTTTFVETENSGKAVMGVSGQGSLGAVVPQECGACQCGLCPAGSGNRYGQDQL